MLTTRNADSDMLARGKSLASDSPPENIKNSRLGFGPLVSKQRLEKMGLDSSPRNIAFRFEFEGSVGEPVKGGKYVWCNERSLGGTGCIHMGHKCIYLILDRYF